ncbi:MAG: neutral/alkaline non-lysosomal ceramidase N-terminal domain-containing protein [Candidatus Latescibacterota bacterium]|jgi:hypothetical protein
MELQLGFGRSDLTPRVGVELCGFGPFLNRHSIAVRDRLWARAMAVRLGDRGLVVVSNDLIQVDATTTARVRERVTAATGLPAESVMVHCTHTHSGPVTGPLQGWGALDVPYLEVLPQRVARAAIMAWQNLQPATLAHAEVPCEGVGLNREYDRDAPPLEEVLREDWRPARPELTDTTCQVLVARGARGVLGFASYFGCHPVVCCQTTRYIHGDFAGVATNLLEREHPGSVGLFLQGAQGDVNTCVVHQPESEALLALDVVAGRYARAVRAGIAQARPLAVERLVCALHPVVFSRRQVTAAEIERRLAEQEAVLHAPDASDENQEVRMAAVTALAYRRFLRAMAVGEDLAPATELQGFRIGPVALLGTPLEVFQAVKNEVRAKSRSAVPLVMGLTNDGLGYAPDRMAAARGGYAADVVPLILGHLPFASIHDELVEHLLVLEARLYAE